MRRIALFIAMSLDGYIADSNGSVAWLESQGNDDDFDAYSEFIKSVDTVLMGWNTYHQIVTELSPEEWVYENLVTYVFTHKRYISSNQIRFTSESPTDVVRALKSQAGKDIWACGGANLVQQLMDEDLIDYFHITVIPTLLGSGIRLFGKTAHEVKLRLLGTRSYNGMTDLVYTRR